jgi:predicted AAA+ superfamily ATPase
LKFKNVFFDEYLTFEEEILLKQLISEALIYGMYPEIAKLNDLKEKILLLDDYFDLIFYKDIIERFNLKSFKKLKIFRKFLLSYM